MKNHLKRILAAILALVTCFGLFSTVNLTANAASADVYMVDLPRGNDPNHSGWGHSAMTFANGWHSAAADHTNAKSIGSYEADTAYCIEPGVPLNVGDTLNSKGEDFWENYPENLNDALDSDEIKTFIGRIFVYGWTGKNDLQWDSTNSTHAQQIAEMLATQYLVWETVVGDRDSNFNWVSAPSGKNNIIDMMSSSHPIRSQIMTHYNRIANSVKNHVSRPSFLSGNLTGASTHDLTWDGSKYTVTLTDNNNLLGNYSFSSTTPGVNFSISGNKLTISMTNPPSGNVDITANKNGAVRKSTVVWTDYIMSSKTSGQIQDLVSYGADVADPVKGYVKLKVSLGSLAIVKTTQHNNGTVSGFTFEVRNSNNTLIGTYMTTSSGKIDIPNLQPGVYSVKEINLSSDFVEPSPNPKSVTVNAGQTATVSFDNIKKRGVITIRKTDANPALNAGFSLSGAVFEVRDAGGTLVDTITTDSTGRAQTKILSLGVYRVKETKAPYGFVLDTETRTATINGTQGTDEIVYAPDVTVAEQPQVGRINMEKYNSTPNMGDYELTPAVFEIRNSNGILVDTLTTDAQGKAQSKDLKLGDYTVSEKTAPYGYVRNTNTFNVKLEYGGQEYTHVYKTVSVPERPQTGIIRVHKLNASPDMGDYPLNSAVFEVRAAQNIKQRDGKVIYNKGDLADTITTNAAGEAQTKELPLGSYTVREKTAPFGFVLNTEEYNPVLSYKGQDVTVSYTDVTVPEQPQVGTITITKLDKVTGTRAQGDSTLKNAVFEVYAAKDIKKLDGSFIYKKDQLVDTLYCGNNNFATSKELPLGDYYYKEKVPPVGYTLDPNSYPVTIEYQGQNVAVVKKYGDLKNKVIEGQIAITKHTDDPDPDVQPGNIQIEAPLEGAIFEVYLKSAESYDKALPTERDLLTTDADGYAKTKLLPYGIYTVKETYAPGDVKLVKPFDVFISKDGNVYRYILSDPWFRSLVKIVKVDSETVKQIPAAGVSFKVKDLSTGKWVVQHINYPTPIDIDVFETAPDGTLVMPESLKSGDYELYEQEAPFGYIRSKDPVKFTIHSTQEKQEIIEVYMANAPAKGIIKIEKKGDMLTGVSIADTTFGKQYTPIFSLTGLKGATFNVIAAEDIYTGDGTLRAAKGTVVDIITTDANGYAETKQLYLGNYTVVETKAPEGFVIDKTPHPVSLVYEGQEVPVVSSQIGIGNTRQTVEIDLQKLMEKPVNAPDDFSAFQDVIFGLFADEDIKGVDGKTVIAKGGLVALMQIDENGKGVVSGELPFAKYYVQELQTNIYYQLNNTKYPVVAEYAGQDKTVSKIQVNNGGIALPNELKLGQITIEKTGEMLVGAEELIGKYESRYRPIYEVRGLSGVVFDVVAAEDVYNVYGKLIHKKGDVVDTVTTDADGKATSKLLHLGKYELVEKTVPYGYVSDGKSVPVTLGFDGQLVGNILEKTVSIFNERQKAAITLDKVMELPENPTDDYNPYADVRFGLYAKEDIKTVDGETVIPTGAWLETFGVDENGKGIIKTDLPFGSFYIKETGTADGYTLDDTAYDVVFDYDSTAGVLVTIAVNGGEPIENRLMRGSLKVIKTFEGIETPIVGVPFTIVGETDVGTTVTIEAVTDENGEILLENLLVGNYTVKELESDLTAGYVLSPEENTIVAADKIAEMTIENKLQRGDLRIIKTFEGKSTPIKGIKFTVTGTSIVGIPFEGEFETDENGVIEITGLPIGEYTVKEIASELTVGYILSEEQTATIATDELTEMAIENKQIRGNIQIIKTDKSTGKPLARAVFGLFKDGTQILEATTDENGLIEFLDVPYGDYEIRELSAPTGYKQIETAFTVSVRENGKTVSVEISNVKIPENSNNPKTGDDSNPMLYVIMMGVSAVALIGMGFARKRRKSRESI